MTALLTVACLRAQIITTIAGTDFSFPPTPLPPANAPFSDIASIAFDSGGNLFLADLGNRAVFRLAPDGSVTKVAGDGLTTPLPRGSSRPGDGGPATSAPRQPLALAIGPDGVLYIGSGGAIRKVRNGIISTLPGSVANAINDPIAIDSAGALHGSDAPGQRVIKIANGRAQDLALLG